jgi:GNAT superfamily N-acetyltransferase
MIRVVRVTDLPQDIESLRAEADRDGVRNMGLLISEWQSGEERFAEAGEALFAAFDDEKLVGIGGVTIEAGKRVTAMRMRRLYVLQTSRKRGVGRMLAEAMMKHGFASADLLTCNAQPPGAAEFWDAMGFARVTAADWTHELTRADSI